jgi:myo-inositol-1(or 4)-monophosphatase
MPDYSNWVDIAVEAANLGGNILQGYFRKVDSNTVRAKSQNDWVSAADNASEQSIVSLLRKRVPDHAILTEESGYLPSLSGKADFCWIIDPLDGTTNFIRGFPIWAVSVALEHRPDPSARWGEIVAGSISIPPTNENFYAILGNGAFRNGKRFTLGEGHQLSEALLGTGFPFRIKHLRGKYVKLFGNLLGRCADVRRPGAVAVDLCYTAMGIFDGFWELDLSPWDVAAGGLIIKEAGGLISNFQGGADYLTTGDIVAGNRLLFNELQTTVREFFPDTRPVNKSPSRT